PLVEPSTEDGKSPSAVCSLTRSMGGPPSTTIHATFARTKAAAVLASGKLSVAPSAVRSAVTSGFGGGAAGVMTGTMFFGRFGAAAKAVAGAFCDGAAGFVGF